MQREWIGIFEWIRCALNAHACSIRNMGWTARKSCPALFSLMGHSDDLGGCNDNGTCSDKVPAEWFRKKVPFACTRFY